jgi:selenocysteine lyase/cysteine desulfurase
MVETTLRPDTIFIPYHWSGEKSANRLTVSAQDPISKIPQYKVCACRVRKADAAHAYAHFPFTRDELGCDYYGTSLHKWLLAPVGTGFLYVRRERIKALWPLMAAPPEMDENIRKYEEIGTHPAANHNAISAALAFHRAIGSERKIARLRYLRDRWAKRLVAESDRVKVLTPLDSPHAGAIGFFTVAGMDTDKLYGWLIEKNKIVTTPITHPEFKGIRITPNVYTTLDEVDLFAEKVLEAVKKGVV